MSITTQWAMFQRVFGFGTIRAQKVLDAVGHPETLFSMGRKECASLQFLLPKEKDKLAGLLQLEQEAEQLLEKAYRMGCTVLTPDSDNYPARLREIYSPPLVLYILGEPNALCSEAAIAMVGTRKYTEYGAQVADDLSYKLAASGYTVVSGLAAGIDAISHRAALRAKGCTVAVLGCGPDIVYPVANTQLHSDIIDNGGAVVTEFPPGEQGLAFHFPIRNRIVSGLSLGVVVVEGSRHSGSLITAGHAVTQNREVFAVPGSIYSTMSQATNWLITQGATMATCAEDILEQFLYIQPSLPKNPPNAQISFDIPPQGVYNDTVPAYLAENQRAVLAAIGAQPATAEDILGITRLPLPAILASLTQLELFGLIEASAGRRFQRK